jgi:hypothetical protein
MANAIDNAIARIQDIAQAITSTTIKTAKDYPVESAPALPATNTYIVGGEFTFTNSTVHHNFVDVVAEFHFNRSSLADAYQRIDAVALEFPKRLASDPTLNGTVTTIVSSGDNPSTYTVSAGTWGDVPTQVIVFSLRLKSLQAPQTTA